jgi:methionine-rich copper-binding protein CopC
MSIRTAICLATALALTATLAAAHPVVVSATPAVNGQVIGSPKDIRIKFNEAPFAKFSGVVVKDAAGKAVKTGKASIDPKDKTLLVVPLAQTLAPGVYKVSWHASGGDTHKVDGAYTFTVK